MGWDGSQRGGWGGFTAGGSSSRFWRIGVRLLMRWLERVRCMQGLSRSVEGSVTLPSCIVEAEDFW